MKCYAILMLCVPACVSHMLLKSAVIYDYTHKWQSINGLTHICDLKQKVWRCTLYAQITIYQWLDPYATKNKRCEDVRYTHKWQSIKGLTHMLLKTKRCKDARYCHVQMMDVAHLLFSQVTTIHYLDVMHWERFEKR